jgi:transcriptional regulator with XRE-family HTH domain
MSTETAFGPRLKQLREEKGLTLQGLAGLAGMHLQGVYKLEAGEREPSWATVRALAKALGVRCTAFEDGPEPSKKGRAKGK